MKTTTALALLLLLGAVSCGVAFAAEDKVSLAPDKLPRPRNSSAELQFRQQILNGPCCVPGVGESDYPVTMKHGQAKLAIPGSEGDATISGITFGVLDKTPVAIAGISVWEGGSGQFHYLLLYELKSKKATQVGSYSIGDRTAFSHPVINNERISVTTEQTIGQEKGSKEHSISRKEFAAPKCSSKQ